MTGGLQRQFVTVSPKPKETTIRYITEVAVLPKLFPRKRVTEMNLDEWNSNRKECIAQGDACVGEAPGVQNDEIDAIGRCFVHPVNEFMFGIALKAA